MDSSMSMREAAKTLAKETGHSERRAYIQLMEARGFIPHARRDLLALPKRLHKPNKVCVLCKGKGEWQSEEDCETYRCPCTEVDPCAHVENNAVHSGLPVRSICVIRDIARTRLAELKPHEQEYVRCTLNDAPDAICLLLLEEIRSLEVYISASEKLVAAVGAEVP